MKTYVTFSSTHIHAINGKIIDKDCVVILNCASHAEGLQLAFEFFDTKFCHTYFEDDFDQNSMVYFPHGFIELN